MWQPVAWQCWQAERGTARAQLTVKGIAAVHCCRLCFRHHTPRTVLLLLHLYLDAYVVQVLGLGAASAIDYAYDERQPALMAMEEDYINYMGGKLGMCVCTGVGVGG